MPKLWPQYDQKVMPVELYFRIGVQFYFLPIPTGSAVYVFGAKSSSSIVRPILYVTDYSMQLSFLFTTAYSCEPRGGQDSAGAHWGEEKIVENLKLKVATNFKQLKWFSRCTGDLCGTTSVLVNYHNIFQKN